ncbi:hypothetical protein JCM9957A_02250 [Kineosporia succinea]
MMLLTCMHTSWRETWPGPRAGSESVCVIVSRSRLDGCSPGGFTAAFSLVNAKMPTPGDCTPPARSAGAGHAG